MDDLIHYEFSIGLPDGWEDRTEVVFVGPKREGSCPTVTVKRIELKAEQTLAQFTDFQMHGLGVLLGVKKLDIIEEGPTKLGGVDAFTRVYHLRFMDKALIQRQVYAIHGESAYVITETSTKAHFADDLPTFDEVIKRFQFRA